MKFNVKIAGVGVYEPQNIVSAFDVDKIANVKKGTVKKKIKVLNRRYVKEETVSFMAKEAILQALENANLKKEELDLICYAGASIEQIIPSTSSLIQKQLGLLDLGIACFDINSTCLSFVTALDHLAILIESNRYKNIALVSSEIASKCINYNHLESAGLFGDGAACVILKKSNDQNYIYEGLHRTYSIGANLCQIQYGGSKFPPNDKNYTKETKEKFLFEMKGKEVFELSYKKLPDFLDELLKKTEINLNDLDYIVPHQASPSSLRIISKKLNFKKEKLINIVSEYGNMIAASIPFAFSKAILEGKIKRGNKILLIGTSAGVSIGGVVIKY
ncbi:MAG: hypothetical protein N4A54_05855 [Peptostreptococcaceae bacterium]|jgi:3-oxoacyl-[acyl-carrier-protein] synthase-3|nr:hypothetical protein [Peptostreptococcaceae bacterium]